MNYMYQPILHCNELSLHISELAILKDVASFCSDTRRMKSVNFYTVAMVHVYQADPVFSCSSLPHLQVNLFKHIYSQP